MPVVAGHIFYEQKQKKKMNNITFVCPLNLKIINKLKDKEIVIVAHDELEETFALFDSVIKTNPIEFLWIKKENKSIVDTEPTEKWAKYPIRYYAKALGAKEEFFYKFEKFTPLNIRFFLPYSVENLTSLQFLTSLGFHTGVLFSSSDIIWEKLLDLFYYHHYTKVGNGTIEPFNYIVKNYKQKQGFNLCADFGNVYFANPSKYIHVENDEQLFVIDIFGNKIYLNESLDFFHKLSENEIYKNISQTWKTHFLENTKCVKCPAWRICQGKFFSQESEYPNCSEFFTTIIES